MEADEIHIFAWAMLGDLQQIDQAEKSRLACEGGRDFLKTDLFDGVYFDFPFLHAISLAGGDVRILPNPDAASNLAAPDAVAEAFGEGHLSVRIPVGSVARDRYTRPNSENLSPFTARICSVEGASCDSFRW
jgi:hypothetical protein